MTIKEFAEKQASVSAYIMYPIPNSSLKITEKVDKVRDKYIIYLTNWITELITEWEKTK